MKIKRGNSYNVLRTVFYLVITRLMLTIVAMIIDDEEKLE